MGTLKIPEIGKSGSTEAPKVDENFEVLNTILDSENKVKGSGMAASAKPFTWYTPVSISKEESRSGAAGVMTTPDEIKEVVVPTNGIIGVCYFARWKSSVSGQGFAGLYLNGEEIDNPSGTAGEGAFTSSTSFRSLVANPTKGLENVSGEIGTINIGSIGQVCLIQAPAATYAISVRYGSLSGTVSAKERKLWVCVLGY